VRIFNRSTLIALWTKHTDNRVVFDIKGNSYRLVVQVR
jgi:mRNA-degrading endonuclease HigB of HigAB toxin-antitoxin module